MHPGATVNRFVCGCSQQRGKNEEAVSLIQKINRINGLSVAADRKMQVVADCIFQQSGITNLANGLTGCDSVTSLDADLFCQTAIAGGITAAVADDHGGAHSLIFIDRVHRTVCRGTYRCPLLGSNVHAIVNTPIPGGLVIAQRVHRVGRHRRTGHGTYPLFRFLGIANRGFCSIRISLPRLGRHCLHIAACRLLAGSGIFLKLGIAGISVIQKSCNADGYRTQHQGYVVALAAEVAGEFLFAHFQAPP